MYTPVDRLCFSLEPFWLLEYVCVRKKNFVWEFLGLHFCRLLPFVGSDAEEVQAEAEEVIS